MNDFLDNQIALNNVKTTEYCNSFFRTDKHDAVSSMSEYSYFTVLHMALMCLENKIIQMAYVAMVWQMHLPLQWINKYIVNGSICFICLSNSDCSKCSIIKYGFRCSLFSKLLVNYLHHVNKHTPVWCIAQQAMNDLQSWFMWFYDLYDLYDIQTCIYIYIWMVFMAIHPWDIEHSFHRELGKPQTNIYRKHGFP